VLTDLTLSAAQEEVAGIILAGTNGHLVLASTCSAASRMAGEGFLIVGISTPMLLINATLWPLLWTMAQWVIVLRRSIIL